MSKKKSESKFNERFRLLKKEKGIGIKALAEKFEVSPSTIGYYLDDRDPSTEMLIKIARKFGVSVDWLVGMVDYRNPRPAASIVSDIPIDNPDDPISNQKLIHFNLDDGLSAEERALQAMQEFYPIDADTISQEAASFKSIKDTDTLFPNKDSHFGNMYDDVAMMNRILEVSRFYIKCIIDVGHVAEDTPDKDKYNVKDMLNILDNLQLVTSVVTELMINYNYFVMDSLCESLTSLDDYTIFKTVTDHEMSHYHDIHSEEYTIMKYDYVTSPFFTIATEKYEDAEDPSLDTLE